jgi:hypothetical protein
MKILALVRHLLKMYFKYGNVPVDLVVEDDFCQTDMPLGDLAYSSRENHVKLLSKGFT